MSEATHSRRERGFSLVEVLVALIIVAVGLLGIAKMQALLLANTGISRVRALVALETSSLAASMHANRDYWSNWQNWSAVNPLTLTIAVNSTSTGSTFTASDATLQSDLSAAIANEGNLPAVNGTGSGSPASCETGGTSVPCTNVNMAAYDLAQWAQAMGNIVGNTTDTVTCTPVNNVVTCTVAVQWTENTVNENTQEQTGATYQTQTYQMVVEP